MEVDFADSFEGTALDRRRWLPYYLPHWSDEDHSRARYVVGGGLLRLLIEEGQEPWCPEYDGEVRVSSIQTATIDGQHRFNPSARILRRRPPERLYTALFGQIEVRLRTSDDPDVMVALWLIGYEDEPEHSGEICVCEIFGRDVGTAQATVGVGVHPFGDPQLVDDFHRVEVPVDAREFHVYAARWTPQRVEFSVDGGVIACVEQSPAYPMQLMLGIYELSRTSGRPYPKELVVDWVRVDRD